MSEEKMSEEKMSVEKMNVREKSGDRASKNKMTAVVLIIIALLLIVMPVIALKGAEFGGSDDAGSVMVEEIAGSYEPWFTPVLETFLGGELPGELESLMFCVQTGIGVGIIAFIFGRLVERKKWLDGNGASDQAPQRQNS